MKRNIFFAYQLLMKSSVLFFFHVLIFIVADGYTMGNLEFESSLTEGV